MLVDDVIFSSDLKIRNAFCVCVSKGTQRRHILSFVIGRVVKRVFGNVAVHFTDYRGAAIR